MLVASEGAKVSNGPQAARGSVMGPVETSPHAEDAMRRMDHYGWLADELTELYEQLEQPGLKSDACDVQRLLLFAIEASNLACRMRRKRRETDRIEPVRSVRRPPIQPRQTRNGPEVALEPATFALGFA